jgi:hypothetical protein
LCLSAAAILCAIALWLEYQQQKLIRLVVTGIVTVIVFGLLGYQAWIFWKHPSTSPPISQTPATQSQPVVMNQSNISGQANQTVMTSPSTQGNCSPIITGGEGISMDCSNAKTTDAPKPPTKGSK